MFTLNDLTALSALTKGQFTITPEMLATPEVVKPFYDPPQKLIGPRKNNEFEMHETSVKTFIVFMNIGVDIEAMYKKRVFEVTPYEIPQKRRGRKKKSNDGDDKPILEDGSIVHVNFRDEFYGIETGSSSAFFRNAMTVIMYVDNKFINFKVSQKKATLKGKLQMTGCKTNEQAKKCTYYFWKHLCQHTDTYTLDQGDIFTVYYECVMRNVGFSMGFKVDRQNLNDYINDCTNHISIFETTLGYAGVNIKFNIDNLEELLDRTIIDKEEFVKGRVIQSTISYRDLVSIMNIKRKKKRYVTFLVFQSGKVIMSGGDANLMREPYYQFIDIITDARDEIEETIDLPTIDDKFLNPGYREATGHLQ